MVLTDLLPETVQKWPVRLLVSWPLGCPDLDHAVKDGLAIPGFVSHVSTSFAHGDQNEIAFEHEYGPDLPQLITKCFHPTVRSLKPFRVGDSSFSLLINNVKEQGLIAIVFFCSPQVVEGFIGSSVGQCQREFRKCYGNSAHGHEDPHRLLTINHDACSFASFHFSRYSVEAIILLAYDHSAARATQVQLRMQMSDTAESFNCAIQNSCEQCFSEFGCFFPVSFQLTHIYI